MTFFLKYWKTILVMFGAVVLAILIMKWKSPHDAQPPQPELPLIQATRVEQDTASASVTTKSEAVSKRKSKVTVTIPAGTIVGDSGDVIIQIESDENTQVVITDDKKEIEAKNVYEDYTVNEPKPEPSGLIFEEVEFLNLFAGCGTYYPLKATPVAGITLHIWKPAYVAVGAAWHDSPVTFCGPALRIGEFLGLKLLAGAGVCTDKSAIVTLSLGG